MSMILWVVLGVIAVIVLALVFMYNSLVNLKNQVKNAWAQIDVQLTRRSDLIPNLVKTVKGYMKHEKELLENVTKARSAVMGATDVQGKAEASNMLSDTLKSLFAVSENYPQLKANENFIQLQEELVGTENKIAYARQHYNDIVTAYNISLQTIPTNMIAGMFNFTAEQVFEASAEEKKKVQVDF